MDCNFPWSADLWEAESASAFSKIAAKHSTELPLPPLWEVATQLLEIPKTAPDLMESLDIGRTFVDFDIWYVTHFMLEVDQP